MNEQSAQHTGGPPAGSDQRFDVVVIGGGAAGLSGALTLARARRSVAVIDGGEPRNAPADAVHGYLGREGTPPGELLAAGRDEVREYGAQVRPGHVVAVERDTAGFAVRLADGGTVLGRRLLVATGMVDELPEVPGVAERWGKDVLHCPYCHGWEVRDRAIGILATGPLAARQALMWRQWSDHITLYLHTAPEPADEVYEQLAARGIAVVDGKVTALEVEGDRLTGVRLAAGTVVPCQALAVAPRFTARADFLAGLGLTPVGQEIAGTVAGSRIPADATGGTSVPGVWVAGNLADITEQVIGSAAAGLRAASAINADLIAEETRRAVAAGKVTDAFSADMERQVCERVLGHRRHGL
ncbi:NAD(P)/FAD-dependent oxidoreductase [Streptomyces sp. NPDC055078]